MNLFSFNPIATGSFEVAGAILNLEKSGPAGNLRKGEGHKLKLIRTPWCAGVERSFLQAGTDPYERHNTK